MKIIYMFCNVTENSDWFKCKQEAWKVLYCTCCNGRPSLINKMKKKNDTPQSPCHFTCPKTGTSKTGFVQVKIMKEFAWINRKFSKFGFWTSRWKKLRQRQHTVKTVPKSNQKILKEAILILLTHVYMTAHFPGTSLKSSRAKLV